ncbi:acid protease [Coniochaeta sp. PMI_546]|nr:acid protease [Coniochaeta sp. PMI_546]
MLPLIASFGFLVPFTTLARCQSQAGHGLIRYPVTAVNEPGLTGRNSAKRQDAVPLSNGKTGTLYTIQLSVGTPPQPVVVVIDTGSSDFWVNPTCSAAPNQVEFCNSFPRFDYTASSTINDTGSSFRLSYGKGSALVEYVTDVVTLGSVVLEDQIFGINTDSNDIPLGILGLAPYLGGSVIFGGIDTKKYLGNLEKRAIIPSSSAPLGTNRYWIYLTSVGVTPPAGPAASLYADTSPGLPVFLDSGGTLTRLPTPLYRAIGEAFISEFPGAFLDEPSGYYVVDCAIAGSPGSVDFGFGAKIIRVAYKDVIWDLGQPDLNICVVGVLPEDDEPVLGDSFLRAAYVVYDQDNRNLHLAQAANCGTELVAIGKGTDAVPSIVGGCGTEPTTSTTTPGPTTHRTTSTTPGSKTTTPGSQITSSSSYPNTTNPATITSTFSSTTVYTITSCPPTVNQCPYGHATTEVVTLTTTFCPASTALYPTTERPATTLSISAPCLNCDNPSSTPSFVITGSGSNVPTFTPTSKPTSVVTAGAKKGSIVTRASFLVIGIAGAAAML